MQTKCYLALDFGGTAVKYAFMDGDGTFLEKGKVDEVPGSVDELILLSETLMKKREVKGIAISIPGVIDPVRGIAHTGGILEYLSDTPLKDRMEEKLKVPVWMDNDAKCAGRAEARTGCLKDVKDGAVIVLGTGVGGCLILDHQVRGGVHLRSGEFSDVFIEHDMTYEKPDTRWWDVNGREGLLKLVQHQLNDQEERDGVEIFKMALDGNEKVKKALYEFTFHLAIEIYNIHALIDVERVAIGGGISAQPMLIEMIREHLDEIDRRDTDFTVTKPEVVACEYRNDANLLGALYGFLEANE